MVESEILRMRFLINQIILWPRKTEFKYRSIQFVPDKINIITGASRTGKSAIIPIIDYCLGANKCTIPVDTIRNTCLWFGLLITLDDEQMLLCRREPGKQASTNEMYFVRGREIIIPESITGPNTNRDAVCNILNELFSMSFVELDSTSAFFNQRPSFRDFMAFLFQPQNIIANADVLFYKADTTEHRQKLINLFPYALGAVTPSVLAARQELDQLRRQRERVLKSITAIKDVSEIWRQEVSGWLAQSKEIGLISGIPDENTSFEEQVQVLEEIITKTEQDSDITPSNIKDYSESLVDLRKQEQTASSELFELQKRLNEMKQLESSMGDYENSLNIQVNRLEISKWLKSLQSSDGTCPFCHSIHSVVTDKLNVLCSAIENLENSANSMSVVPAAFQREMLAVTSEIAQVSERLHGIRNRINLESLSLEQTSERKYTLSEISRFLGRMEASIQTYKRIGEDSELQKQLENIDKRIAELSLIVDEDDISRKQRSAIAFVNQKIGEIIKSLDSEYPNDPVSFQTKDLTLKVHSVGNRDNYLWEIGSASNWLAYHIATSLAFQWFFQSRAVVSVPNFMVFDQPSQVYFPQKARRRTENDTEELELDDEDKIAVKKVFSTISDFLTHVDQQVQVIVTEHADEDIWGDIESVHLVARWRDNGEKLVPMKWIDSTDQEKE